MTRAAWESPPDSAFSGPALMGESDPYLIEVKAPKKLDSLGNKQKREPGKAAHLL